MGEIEWLGVSVAWARHDDLRGFTETQLQAMGSAQRERAGQLPPDRADAFVAGRALIAHVAARLGVPEPLTLDSSCARCSAHHAAPRIHGAALSVSHAGDLVVVAASTEASSVGVDVEAVSAAARVAELASMFGADRAPDLAGWTRIEAAVKADGRAFEIDPDEVRLLPPPAGSDLWSARVPGRPAPFRVTTLDVVDGFALSVARD